MATNSLYTTNSRYTNGGTTETSGNFLEWWNRKVFNKDSTDFTMTLDKTYEGRPDKLATVLYDDSSLWWVILQYNGILDLNTEFIEGVTLTIPTKDRVLTEFITGSSGGVSSTRITS